jgi:hypothetical protein
MPLAFAAPPFAALPMPAPASSADEGRLAAEDSGERGLVAAVGDANERAEETPPVAMLLRGPPASLLLLLPLAVLLPPPPPEAAPPDTPFRQGSRRARMMVSASCSAAVDAAMAADAAEDGA